MFTKTLSFIDLPSFQNCRTFSSEEHKISYFEKCMSQLFFVFFCFFTIEWYDMMVSKFERILGELSLNEFRIRPVTLTIIVSIIQTQFTWSAVHSQQLSSK